MEQWSLAVISFKMWGELSPTKEHPVVTKGTLESIDKDAAKKKDDDLEQKKVDKTHSTLPPLPSTTKRTIGQAEVESAFFKVQKILKFTKFSIKTLIIVRWNLLRSF